MISPSPPRIERTVLELRAIDDENHLPIQFEPEYFPEQTPSYMKRYGAFILMVVVPIFVSIIYVIFLETDQYKAESQFIIRSVGSGSVGGALSLAGGSNNLSRSDDDAYAVAAYLKSRDLVGQIAGNLKDYFGHNFIDRLHRYPPLIGKATIEQLFELYENHVAISANSDGINTLDVYAYSPVDAKELNTLLLKQGEDLVNRLNSRAEDDELRASKATVDEAQKELEDAQGAILEFRNRELIIDPEKQGAADLEIISQLASRQAQAQASLAQTVVIAPKSPQITQMKEQIKAIQTEIEQQKARIVGGKESLIPKLAEFDRISLRRELALRGLTSAVSSYEAARHEARTQRFFLETVVMPILSDRAAYPHRSLIVGLVAAAAFVLFWITRKTLHLIADHQF